MYLINNFIVLIVFQELTKEELIIGNKELEFLKIDIKRKRVENKVETKKYIQAQKAMKENEKVKIIILFYYLKSSFLFTSELMNQYFLSNSELLDIKTLNYKLKKL